MIALLVRYVWVSCRRRRDVRRTDVRDVSDVFATFRKLNLLNIAEKLEKYDHRKPPEGTEAR